MKDKKTLPQNPNRWNPTYEKISSNEDVWVFLKKVTFVECRAACVGKKKEESRAPAARGVMTVHRTTKTFQGLNISESF